MSDYPGILSSDKQLTIMVVKHNLFTLQTLVNYSGYSISNTSEGPGQDSSTHTH